MTVLFPHDDEHAKADMTRISSAGCSGASIAQGMIEDVALESSGGSVVNYNGISFWTVPTPNSII